MKLLDKNGRLFGKLSIIDLAVIFFVIIIAIGAYIRFAVTEPAQIEVAEAPVRYIIEVENVRDWAQNNIRVGDRLFVSGTSVGTVVNIEAIPYVMIVTGDRGVWHGEVPGRYRLFVEMEATATVRAGRYFVSRTVPMDIGNSPTHFTSRYADFHAVIKEIGLNG